MSLDILHGLKLVLVPETEHEHEYAEAEFSRIHVTLVTSHDAGRALARSPLNVPEKPYRTTYRRAVLRKSFLR